MKKSTFTSRGRLLLGAIAFSFITTLPASAAPSGPGVRFADSVKIVRGDAPAGNAIRVREQLTESESAASLNFVVSLRMRNFDRFQTVLQSGGTVTKAEMEADYLPLKRDYDRVASWLAAQGFTPTLVDQGHTNIFVRGTIAKIAGALDVAFARVATSEGEFTSAVAAPALPAELAEVVLGIDGLQPHVQLQADKNPSGPTVDAVHLSRAIPADLLAAYHVPGDLDGSGQTIAIVMGAVPLASDLTAFYQSAGITANPANFTIVPVNGGPTADSQTDAFTEVTLDSEWASGIAPGAKLMVYATPSISIADFVAACTQIMNDGQAKIVSHSASALESGLPPTSLRAYSQVFAQMAAAGITVLHGSGDNGTNGTPTYPASDPFVAALSGTTMTFDANWNATDEVVWPSTGGGVSAVFARPSWQSGPGVPAGTMRCVPDAASISTCITTTGTLFPFVIRGGQTVGVGGSSLTGPVWAGLIAIINQARAKVGLPTVGLLGPKIYPLIGTSAFKDITVGSNGAYNAGAGYDLCSGAGSPNVTALIQAFANAPAISAQPVSQAITSGGTVVFRAAASGNPAPAYQWLLNGAKITGASGSMFVINGATPADAGVYTCVATNASGSITSTAATLAIAATADFGRLSNLSILTEISAAVPNFTVGTVIGGAGTTGSKPLLVRAAGPSLTPLGVGGALADPKLDFFSGQTVIASNDNWNGDATLAGAFTSVGAFAYVSALSKDAAIFNPALAAGSYTVQVSGVGGATGAVIAELYDATPAGALTATTPRLTNVSVLKQIGAGGTLTAGFVVAGSTSKTVLIRAIGPALGLAPFNIPGTMADPQLTLYNGSSAAIAANNDWGGDGQLVTAGARVGAFSIGNAPSKDAVLLITLSPGSYTVQVSGVNNTGGLAIVEVYEVP